MDDRSPAAVPGQGGAGPRPGGLSIGPITLAGRAILAPMAGVTDRGMRRIACRFGASLAVSEMVAAASLTSGNPESVARAQSGGLAVHAVQIAGCEPQPMAEAARHAQDGGAALIDINMGCPAKRVTGGYSGSALMRDLDHAVRLIDATVRAVSVPVTVKMRLGWDSATINAPELARRAEGCGARMITVHGRTRQQFYTGTADWSAVRAVKAAVSIPVVVNGDCLGPDDARRMLEASGADAVMLGRGAIGQPWLVGRIADYLETGILTALPSAAARGAAAREHYQDLLTLFGIEKGLRHARKHLAAYAQQADHTLRGRSPEEREALRARLVTSTDTREVDRLLARVFDQEETPDCMDQAA